MSKKKTILALTLAMVLLPALAAAQGVPGESSPQECCYINHDLGALGGDTDGVDKGDVVCPVIDTDCDEDEDDCELNCDNCDLTGEDNPRDGWGAYCLIDTVYTVTDWIFWVVFVIGALIVLFGGIQIMFAKGDPETAKKGGNVITFGVIGIVVAIVSKIIPSVAQFFVR